MSWTYDDPVTIPKDQVRFLIQDTDSNKPEVTDEEIAYALGTVPGSSAVFAAYFVARALMRRYARLVDRTVGTVSIQLSQKYNQWRQIADDLKELTLTGEMPGRKVYAGGLSVAEKALLAADTDLVKPFFSRDMLGGVDE